jgi:hypothetical protein
MMDTGCMVNEQGRGDLTPHARALVFRLLVLHCIAAVDGLPMPAAARWRVFDSDLASAGAAQPEHYDALVAIGRLLVADPQFAVLGGAGELFDEQLLDASVLPRLRTAALNAALHALAGDQQAWQGYSARSLGDMYERLNQAGRRSRGAFYTPAAIVDRMLDRSLGALLDQIAQQNLAPAAARERLLALRICDPAAGCGHFLAAAADRLTAALASLSEGASPEQYLALRRQVLEQCIAGVELDPLAAAIARVGLCLPHILAGAPIPNLGAVVRAGNALTGAFGNAASAPLAGWRAAFPHAPDGFDLVIGNPPYIDSERMAREQPELRWHYARVWQTARGNWDMFVVFVELGMQLTRPGGRCTMIVPNRLLDADYARSVRDVLRQSTIEYIHDYSTARPFGASAYPVVFSVRRALPPADEPFEVGVYADARAAAAPHYSAVVERATLDQLPGGWSALLSGELGWVRACLASGSVLSDIADVREAATVTEAYALAALIHEQHREQPGESLRLVNTGTIDPFRALWGQRDTRYLGHSYSMPAVSLEQLRGAFPRLAQRATLPKLVVAGLARRLEVCADNAGRVLAGKSTVVVCRPRLSIWFLVALLNSSVATRLYRALFGGLALQGGYLRIGAPQLARLPLPQLRFVDSASERVAQLSPALALLKQGDDQALLALCRKQGAGHDLVYDLLAELGRRLSEQPDDPRAAGFEALIDALAEQCYLGVDGRQ